MRLISLLLMLGVIGITIHRNRRWPAPVIAVPAVAVNEQDEEAAAVNDAPVATPVPAGEQRAEATVASPDQTTTPADTQSSDTPDKSGEESGLGPDDQWPKESTPPPDVAAADTGSDDRNPEEAAEFRRQAEAITDWGLAIQGIENPAYWRLLSWLGGQSLDELEKRDPPRAVFQQLRQHPNKYRGKLLSVELSVVRVNTYEVEQENPAGIKRLYELWAWPTSGSGWFYVVVTPELPEGFPTEIEIRQTVRVYGYFFKLQGYQPANAKPNAPPLAAPMIVGRVEWIRLVTPTNPAEVALSYMLLAGGGVLLVGVIGYWVIAARRKKLSHAAAAAHWPAVAAHDDEDGPLATADAFDDEHDPERPPPDAFDWVRD